MESASRVSALTFNRTKTKMELSQMCNIGILEWLDTDDLTDFLLAKASDDYENTHAPASTPTHTSPSHSLTASSSAAEDEGTSSARSSSSNPEQQTAAIPQHPKTGATVLLAGQEAAIQSCSSSTTSTVIRFAAPKRNEEKRQEGKEYLDVPCRTQSTA